MLIANDAKKVIISSMESNIVINLHENDLPDFNEIFRI